MSVPNGKWLIAVSAGPDSMALFSMCLKAKVQVEAAHVNYHHQRQAAEEEEYLRNFCHDNGVILHVLNEPFVPKGNFEAQARAWRYDFFEKIVKKERLSGVLVAHQMDDLLETYLMQKEKNIVPEHYGLKEEASYHGIRVQRPLLGKTKQELEEYCRTNGIRYYIDETNDSDAYERNRIRHDLIEKMSCQERKDLLKEIEEKNRLLQKVREQAEKLLQQGCIDKRAYAACDENVRLSALRMLCEKKPLHRTLAFYRQCDEIIRKKNDFEIEMQGKLLVSDGKKIFLIEKGEPYSFQLASMQQVAALGRQKYFTIEKGVPGVFALSVKESDFPLTIRSAEDGDAIVMRYGRKKVSRFFIDRHIPRYQRRTWPVVENGKGEVILVSGLGCDVNHYSVKPDFCVIQCTAVQKECTDDESGH